MGESVSASSSVSLPTQPSPEPRQSYPWATMAFTAPSVSLNVSLSTLDATLEERGDPNVSLSH